MIVLAVSLPWLVLGWAVFIALGAVVAFSVYAVLAGRREDKEYKNTALPGQEMMAELAREKTVDDDSLESIDLDAMNHQADPMPSPVLPAPMMPSPASMPLPAPAMSMTAPLSQPGGSAFDGSQPVIPVPGQSSQGKSDVMSTLDSLIGTAGEGDDTAGFYDHAAEQQAVSVNETGPSMPGNPFMSNK